MEQTSMGLEEKAKGAGFLGLKSNLRLMDITFGCQSYQKRHIPI